MTDQPQPEPVDINELKLALETIQPNEIRYAPDGVINPVPFADTAARYATGRLSLTRRGVPFGEGSTFRVAVAVILDCYNASDLIKGVTARLIDMMIANYLKLDQDDQDD